MNQSLSFSEMNQAVPCSMMGSPPSYMESNMRGGEYRVPSPSQWSDPSRSPPSLHSPSHFSSFEYDVKMKEEPFSPRPYVKPVRVEHTLQAPHTPQQIGLESSINLAELLEENRILTSQSMLPRLTQDVQNQSMGISSSGIGIGNFDFLDLLVDVKKETEDVLDLVGMGMTPPVSPQGGVIQASQAYVQTGDVLKTVERMALEHFRQDLQRVSDKLGIPKDPSCWSLEEAKSWLLFQACQLNLPSPHLDYWRFAGAEMIKLTEANFRELIPQGGELLYAKLEIWREALRTSYELPQQLPSHYGPQRTSVVNVQHNVISHSNMYTETPIQSVSNFMLPPYQSPRTSCFSTPPLNSPQSPLQINISSPLQISISSPSMSSQCSPIQVQSPSSSVPSPPMTPQVRQPVSPAAPNNSFFLEEACLDMATFLQQTEDSFKNSPKVNPSVDGTKQEVQEPEEEVVEPVTVTRGGTHIHLWQFLKELLNQPQQYGTCIRWLERSKGVFKIEDSVRVAKVWGKRKNRPAMNYDKLSRSIRQYYKKGIMKKTERSQRLVYQFCHPYCL